MTQAPNNSPQARKTSKPSEIQITMGKREERGPSIEFISVYSLDWHVSVQKRQNVYFLSSAEMGCPELRFCYGEIKTVTYLYL